LGTDKLRLIFKDHHRCWRLKLVYKSMSALPGDAPRIIVKFGTVLIARRPKNRIRQRPNHTSAALFSHLERGDCRLNTASVESCYAFSSAFYQLDRFSDRHDFDTAIIVFAIRAKALFAKTARATSTSID
jgi:hypothetical protein